MWSVLLLSGVLSFGQVTPSVEPSPSPPSAPQPDRWLLMQALQGTYHGWLLDGNKVRVSGWTEMSFTASSDRYDQLPMGFGYRTNEFLLRQHWLRVERPVDQTATAPSFGFRFDTIVVGSDYRFTIARGLFDRQLIANNGEPAT